MKLKGSVRTLRQHIRCFYRSPLRFVCIIAALVLLWKFQNCVFGGPDSCWPIAYLLSNRQPDYDTECIYSVTDRKQKCRPVCWNGSFSLFGMTNCHSLLSCDEIENIVQNQQIGEGLVKLVHLAEWNGYNVAFNQPKTLQYVDDYTHGVNMLKRLNKDTFATQILGYCDDITITEYHSLGEALNLEKLFKKHLEMDNIKTRFGLCVDYVKILTALHHGHDSVIYVMCDTNSLEKVLIQYLLREDFRLILNDVDSLNPILFEGNKKQLITCGKKQIDGQFVAPEQLWPFDGDFDMDRMPKYDEKTDIWKIPEVCNFFLGDSRQATQLKLKLLNINSACKSFTSQDRPSANDVLKVYKEVMDLM